MKTYVRYLVPFILCLALALALIPSTLVQAAGITKPAITTQPKSVSVKEGETASFKVVASGGGLKYQWYYQKPDTTTWTKVSVNGTSATYNLKTEARHNGYKYRCLVSNTAGEVYSSTATLTVSAVKPAITTQPKSISVKEGETASFKVVASGSGLKYQWYYQKPGTTTWTKVSVNGTSATYNLKTEARHNGYKYRCLVSNTAGEVYSSTATLTVSAAKPTITTQPKDVTVFAGQTASFKVVASGSGLKYQWYYQKPGTTTWTKVSVNGTSATYSLATEARHNGYKYRCVVTNSGGSVTSSNVTLTVKSVAYVYGFDFRDGIVNTTEIAWQERNYLEALGYNAYCNTAVDSFFATGKSPTTDTSRMNSGVVAINGHAGPGSMEFRDSSGKATYLTAIKSGVLYSSFKDIDMSNCRAALFFGCKTASTKRSSTHGVLTDQAVSNGATCAFGWKISVDTDAATFFRERMFFFLRYGYSVRDAAKKAASEMPWFDETRQYVIAGDGSVTLTLSDGSSSASVKNNTLDIDAISAIIDSADYRMVEKTESGSYLYVRYIGDVPTLESMEVNYDTGFFHKTDMSFSENEVNKALDLVNKTNKAIFSSELDDVIYDGNTVLNAVDNGQHFDVICKLDNKMRFVRIIFKEYASEDGETFYLKAQCIDLNTGENLNYGDILEAIHE